MRLQDPVFFILVALAGGARHGYGIVKEVLELSQNELRLGAGTLYTALDRLASEGHIEVDREEREQGRLRRYYRLTPKGHGLLTEEIRRREAGLRSARARLRLAARRAG